MLYETHYKEGKKVFFKKFDLKIAGLLFLPDRIFNKKPAKPPRKRGRRGGKGGKKPNKNVK